MIGQINKEKLAREAIQNEKKTDDINIDLRRK